jgi:hypothetical protein
MTKKRTLPAAADASASERPDFRKLFDPAMIFEAGEAAILRVYFGLKRRRGDAPLKSLYTDDEVSDGPIRLWRSVREDPPVSAMANAVARICLAGLQDRLPQWATFDSNGKEWLGRQEFGHEPRLSALQPAQLLCINWADSGPGFSWPEEYCVTYVPGFARYVVTASVDSTDSYGVTDLAIGSFGQEEDFDAGCQRVVREWWQLSRSMSGGAWQYVFDEGLIDEKTALRLRHAVWPEETDDPDMPTGLARGCE